MGKKDKIEHPKKRGEEMVFTSLSLPAALVEELKLLKDCYEDSWKEEEGGRVRVTYEKLFARLLSKSGLGHVDPDVYKRFTIARRSRVGFQEVVKRATKKAVEEISTLAKGNDALLIEEAQKAQEKAKAELEKLRAGTPYINQSSPIAPDLTKTDGTIKMQTEKRFVHPDGRWFPATMGTSTWVPVDPKTNKWFSAKQLKEQGFELKDVKI